MWAYLKFRLQRSLRQTRRDLLLWRSWFSKYLDLHVWGKWRHLGIIRRLAVTWWGILVLSFLGIMAQVGGLGSYYLRPVPVPGGTYMEGVIGQIQNINPILPEPGPAADASRLIFSGLTQINPERQIVGDLATSWTVSPDGRSYTFKLRHGVKWHDGVPFTSRDVLFTLTAIQNPDTRSPLATSWQGIQAQVPDDYTVTFTLPNAYSPFIYATTVGILPSHLLESTDPSALRASQFNQNPIGTGPFKLKSFLTSSGEIQLAANPDYYSGRPRLDAFTLKLYNSTSDLFDAYAKRQINAIARLDMSGRPTPAQLADLHLYRLGLADETAVFFKTSSGVLSNAAVRNALAAATDRSAIARDSLDGYATVVSLPLLPGTLGYSTAALPSQFDPAAAVTQLTSDGWQKINGVMTKNGQPLILKLVTSTSPDYQRVAEQISRQWGAIGVRVNIVATDLNNLEQSYIRPRNYDVLLYGINLGADPDVYSYWHSSQVNDPGLNLSQYANHKSDQALESGRILADPDTRAVKYQAFLSAWIGDNPAVILYNPDYIYATSPSVRGVAAERLVDPSDRFFGVQNWTVQTTLRAPD